MRKLLDHCPECGGAVKMVKKAGRTARYGTMHFKVPASFPIMTCVGDCGARFFDKESGKALDDILKPMYQAALAEKAKTALTELARWKKRYQLEGLLGLSTGYLSKVASGAVEPGASLVASLMLLAKDIRRLAELEDAWGGDGTRADDDGHVRKAS